MGLEVVGMEVLIWENIGQVVDEGTSLGPLRPGGDPLAQGLHLLRAERVGLFRHVGIGATHHLDEEAGLRVARNNRSLKGKGGCSRGEIKVALRLVGVVTKEAGLLENWRDFLFEIGGGDQRKRRKGAEENHCPKSGHSGTMPRI